MIYYLEYVGDYGLQAFLDRGGASSDEEIVEFMTSFLTKGLFKYKAGATDAFGCSAVSAKNKDGGYIFGRNFDWLDCTALIVKTIPKVGYTSISTTNVNFLGLEYGAKPKGIIDKMTMLGSTYAPLDGMNEKGLWSQGRAVLARIKWN